MANGDSYATVDDYYKVKDKKSQDDAGILEWQLVAVSRLLDLKLNQPYGFNQDAVVTTRVYGPGDQIAPIASVTGLVVKTAATGAAIDWPSIAALVLDTDFELTPLNPRAGWPYTGISFFTSVPYDVVINPSTYRGTNYRTQVTAIHGWPGVPEAIKDSTIRLTSILREESVFTTDRVQELDQAVGVSLQARGLLKSLYEVYNPYPVGVG